MDTCARAGVFARYNALVHGRKRWLLRPPSDAVLSTQHPLEWLRASGTDLLEGENAPLN
jgi:phage host-nuclease inhibitor protein Gam